MNSKLKNVIWFVTMLVSIYVALTLCALFNTPKETSLLLFLGIVGSTELLWKEIEKDSETLKYALVMAVNAAIVGPNALLPLLVFVYITMGFTAFANDYWDHCDKCDKGTTDWMGRILGTAARYLFTFVIVGGPYGCLSYFLYNVWR